MVKKLVPPLIVVLFSLFSIRPLFSKGFFPMHDDAQVARVIVMANALRHGQFPVRLVSDLGYGYGYPLYNFYGPLPYYAGGILHLLGFDALVATKMMMGIGAVIGSVAMYVFSSSLFGAFGGLFSAVLFTYFPYRAVQLYVRGAIGELWAVSFLPLVLLGVLVLAHKESREKWILCGGLALSAVILSHTVFGYIATCGLIMCVLILFLVSILRRNRNIRTYAVSLTALCAVALGLTAFFWLPAATETEYTNVYKAIGKTADYRDHFICIFQLWDHPWGFGGSTPGCIDGMSFKLGKVHVVAFVAAYILWFLSKNKEKRINGIMEGMGIGTLFLLFLMLPISYLVWKYIPFSSFIQYPWRFLGPVGVCMSYSCAYLLYRKKREYCLLFLCIIGGCIVLVNRKVFTPQYLYERIPATFSEPEELRWRASKVSDEYLPKDITIPHYSSEIIRERVSGDEFLKIHRVFESETKGTYAIEANQDQELKLNMAFFPGWKFWVNGREVRPEVVDGQPSVILSAGHNLLEMRFLDTPVRKIGNGLTIVTIVGIGTMYYIWRENHQ